MSELPLRQQLNEGAQMVMEEMGLCYHYVCVSQWHRWQRDLKINVSIRHLHEIITSTLCSLVNSFTEIAHTSITSGIFVGHFLYSMFREYNL